MKLCVIPLLMAAASFIAHSVIIAYQVKDNAADAYLSAVSESVSVEAVKNVSLDMGWIAGQWIIVFSILFVCFYIPITINIKKLITPIRQAAGYSDSLAEGNVNINVIKDRSDEIGILQESFKRLVEGIRQQAKVIESMAEGDLTKSYTPRSSGDVIGNSLVQMLKRNNEALFQVAVSAKQLASAAEQTAEKSQIMAGGSGRQAASVEEISASITEITKLSGDNESMAKKASGLSSEIKENAEKGNRQMEQMLSAVKDISEATESIRKIIKTVEDIAFQTNILALNASVEAARAGIHGKGFAVVADEVRNLATKSADAAKDTGSLIAASIEKTTLGVRIADETAESLSSILAGIGESGQLIAKIADSSERQSSGIKLINNNINEVSFVVQENSAIAEELAAASEEISGQITMLKDLISRFKLLDG